MQSALTIYNKEVLEFIQPDFICETLVTDASFTEGPVWNPEGFYLFSDIPQNCIYRWDEWGGKKIFLAGSGSSDPHDPLINQEQPGSNGLAYDSRGRLIICQHGNHGLAIYEDEKPEPLIRSFNDRAFNSPNDLVIHPDGTIYFSDPPYGLKDGQLNPDHFQPLAGVYAFRNGSVELICDHYQYPNGLCLSPDGKILYICSSKPFEKFISCYELPSHRFIGVLAEENSDGIKPDVYGNLYLCTKEGIIILNRQGERMARIELGAIPANACWGGNDGADLLVTARQFVYRIKNLMRRSRLLGG